MNQIQKQVQNCGSFAGTIREKNIEENENGSHGKAKKYMSTGIEIRKIRSINEDSDGISDYDQQLTSTSFFSRTTIQQKKIKRKLHRSTIKKGHVDSKSLFDDLNARLKMLSEQYVSGYFTDILDYLLKKQAIDDWFNEVQVEKWRQIVKEDNKASQQLSIQTERMQNKIGLSKKAHKPSNQHFKEYPDIQKIDWDIYFDGFALVIENILQILFEGKKQNSGFASCYFFYMMVISDPQALEAIKDKNFSSSKIQHLVINSIFIATKYHQIYPISVQTLIDYINEEIEYKRVLHYEALTYKMTNFNQFYTMHQGTFLSTFLIIVDWSESHCKSCHFLLESGLNNPYLFEEKPSYKACAIIIMYEKSVLRGNKATEIVRYLTGIPLKKQKEIIKKYNRISQYNKRNNIFSQKRKYLWATKNSK